jgi:hypothetical protein
MSELLLLTVGEQEIFPNGWKPFVTSSRVPVADPGGLIARSVQKPAIFARSHG